MRSDRQGVIVSEGPAFGNYDDKMRRGNYAAGRHLFKQDADWHTINWESRLRESKANWRKKKNATSAAVLKSVELNLRREGKRKYNQSLVIQEGKNES